MAQDIQLRRENRVMAKPDEHKTPEYEYQAHDSRSFSVRFSSVDERKESDKAENSSGLKVC